MRTRWVAVALAIAIGTGCPGDSGTGPEEELTGTYQLRSINNAPLPFVSSQTATEKIETIEGSLTLKSDDTFAARFVDRITRAGTASTREEGTSGTYRRAGAKLTFTDAHGTTEGVIQDGRTITVELIEGTMKLALTFQK